MKFVFKIVTGSLVCSIADCTCPPPPPEPDDPLKPLKPTPVDCLGYPATCCGCIPLRVAAILICILSFIWAIVELAQSEKKIGTILDKEDPIFKYFNACHIFVIICYLITCGVLMLGIMAHRLLPIHVYVWSAFIFNCLCTAVDIASVAAQVISTGSIPRRAAMSLVICVFYHSIFFYFISVVNSFKYRYWW